MKTYLFLLMVVMCSVSAFVGSGCKKKSMEARFMEVGRYVSEHCAGSVAYDSLPVRYTRALDVGKDSADLFLRGLEEQIWRGKCPE